MRIHLQQVHQSMDGSEHFMIDRAPQPPPRVLPGNNTNRNVSDIVGIVSTPLPPPPPAALPTVVISNAGGSGNIMPTGVNPLAPTTPSVTLTPVNVNAANLSMPPPSIITTTASNPIGTVTLTPVNPLSNPKSVTLTPVIVHHQQGEEVHSGDPRNICSVSASNGIPNFITSNSNTEMTQLPHISLPSLPSHSQSSAAISSMICSNNITTMNIANSLTPNLINNISLPPNHSLIDLPVTSLSTALPTLPLPPNLVTSLAANTPACSVVLPTTTNSLPASTLPSNLQAVCTNTINQTILTNVLNSVSSQATSSVSVTAPHHTSTAHHNNHTVLSNNGIPLIVTKIEENAVH